MNTLDKFTFGKTPAAMYLATHLNEHGNSSTARKCSRVIEAFRSTLNDVVCSHMHTDEMTARTFNRLIIMLREVAKRSPDHIPDRLAAELVRNILVGETKSWINRASHTKKLQRMVQRRTPPGKSVQQLTVTPRIGEETEEERIERLKERSRNYLQRKNKINTLY